jgi:hypothetical protein
MSRCILKQGYSVTVSADNDEKAPRCEKSMHERRNTLSLLR